MTEPKPAFTHRPERRGLVGPFSGRQLALAGASIVVAALAIVAVTTPLASTGGGAGLPDPRATQVVFASPTEGLAVGERAPELGGQLPDGTSWQLTDLDGQPIRLADLRGRPVWINFWASWCPPCQQETPILRQVAAEYADEGLVVIGVQVQETVDEGRDYAARYGLTYPIGADVAGHAFRAYQVFGLPTQFFIDPDGVIRAVAKTVTLEDARAYVEAILPPDPPGSGSAPPPTPSPSAP